MTWVPQPRRVTRLPQGCVSCAESRRKVTPASLRQFQATLAQLGQVQMPKRPNP